MTRSSRIPVRCAGTLVPLFSISSETSWGIGEIADLPRLASWCAKAGLSFVQLLPIHEMPEHETSPYSALSAMAIDPQFIALSQVEDFEALGGEPGLAEEERRHLDDARDASRVAYDVVRQLKARVLRRCFDRFVTNEIAGCSHRAEDFARYVEEERWWLDDYALFRALREQHGRVGWTEWPAPLAAREPEALNEARRTLASEMRYRQYLQWIADGQWSEARTHARSAPPAPSHAASANLAPDSRFPGALRTRTAGRPSPKAKCVPSQTARHPCSEALPEPTQCAARSDTALVPAGTPASGTGRSAAVARSPCPPRPAAREPSATHSRSCPRTLTRA